MAELFALSDLNTEFDEEPRIRDLLIGERLGYERPRDVRKVIEKNIEELEAHGLARQLGAPIISGKGRETIVQEYWLNEAQALLICMFARTDTAVQVRQALITVFMAWRRGQLPPSPVQHPLEIDEDKLPLYLSLVREMRLAHGKAAARTLWRQLPLPQPEAEPANQNIPDEIVTAFLDDCVQPSAVRGAVL